ncbi:MAG TPA: SDR family oxidoreductase [Candidatus Binataceae bacterium]|nr:SDR family oxidoreductase [Candidatus Binataceae bacterium]
MSLRLEAKNAIIAGFINTPINTPMTANLKDAEGFMKLLVDRVPLGRVGEAVDVATTVLFLGSEEGRYYPGSILHPDGGVVMQ